MSLHSKLSPSAASRWSRCTASVGFIESSRESGIIPADEGSKYADEGTEAHEWAAKWLRGESYAGLSANAEMFEHVKGFVEFVRSLVRPGDRLLIERRFALFYKEEDYGTSDDTVIGPGRIVVADLKYGQGVSVDAFENEQLGIYAESLIRELEEIEDIPGETLVEMYIYQPRDRSNPEPVREWKISRSALAMFTADISAVAQNILSGGEVRFVADPDKQCRFCPAKGICKAYAADSLKCFGDESVDATVASSRMIELSDPKMLTREQRVRVLLAKKGIISWLEAVEDQEMTDLLDGKDRAGFKLVEGKSNRRWTDPEAVKKLLRNYLTADEICPPSDPISPAQAEKLLKGKETSTRFENRLASLIEKPSGKPSLVPESDPRPALQNGVTEFEDLGVTHGLSPTPMHHEFSATTKEIIG